ncbi:hypothetical protein FRC08_005795, partial [Ceratobasidium sp. 394]
GFHIDGKHFPIHSVVAERTPHEVYAYSAAPQPELQVIGKVVGRCGVQRTLTEGDQEKLLQSRSAAENASTRTIGRLGVPGVPSKGAPAKRKPTVKKNVIDANTAAALRASPAPGTAGNSPPPTTRPTTLDGPPNAFQTLLIHHLAYAPSTLQRLATAVKRQPKEIRGCLDSIATSDDSPTGPRPESPTWTLRPSSYQYLRLAAPNGSASGGPWLALTPEDTKRMIADANRAFDQLKLPPDAPPRLALAAQQPTPPPPPTPVPSVKSQETTTTTTAALLKHPLPARPTTTTAPNGRLDAPKPSRVPSPAVPASDVGASPRETPAVSTPRAPVRVSAAVKEKIKTEGDAEPISTKKNGSTKSKSNVNGKEKTKVKSKPIITADSDGEDFVATKRDRERKPPPPAAAPPPPRPTAISSTHHSRAPSTTSSRSIADSSTKKSKRDADIALELEREIDVHDSGFIDSSSRSATAAPTKTKSEGKKRRINEEAQPRVRTKEVDRGRVKESKVGSVRDPERKVKTASREVSADVKRKRDVDQESDVSYTRDVEKKKKRRTETAAAAVGAPSTAPIKREQPVREREADTSAAEARPKKPLPARDPDLTPRVKEKPRKSVPAKTNGASTSASASTSRLLKDMDDGDHDALLDAPTVETLTKAYRDAHDELVALKVRVGAGA